VAGRGRPKAPLLLSGVGYRPQTWQGWVILEAGVATLIVFVVLLRTGLL
jgi:hypothetical protein